MKCVPVVELRTVYKGCFQIDFKLPFLSAPLIFQEECRMKVKHVLFPPNITSVQYCGGCSEHWRIVQYIGGITSVHVGRRLKMMTVISRIDFIQGQFAFKTKKNFGSYKTHQAPTKNIIVV